jgi:hypothetical protein
MYAMKNHHFGTRTPVGYATTQFQDARHIVGFNSRLGGAAPHLQLFLIPLKHIIMLRDCRK